jgi:hypothetical protein
MFDEKSKKYIIGAILAILVVALISAGFGIWRFMKQKNGTILPLRPTKEEIIKSLSAPAETSKTARDLTSEEKKIIHSLSAPAKSSSAVKNEILNSLNAPEEGE